MAMMLKFMHHVNLNSGLLDAILKEVCIEL
jgi:hypothetical protein